MRNKYITIVLGILIISITNFSCKKDWLEEKRDVSLVVPQTLEDLKSLLNFEIRTIKIPLTWGEVSVDDYYFPVAQFSSQGDYIRLAYTWEKEIFPGLQEELDWNYAYNLIFTTNVILETVENIPETNENRSLRNSIKGSALYIRAQTLYGLNQSFAPTFSEATADSELGVPIDLSAAVDNKLVRASLRENYNQIISDMTEAAELLPVEPEFISDPSKGAAHGFLARIYLMMGKFEEAEEYADWYLAEHRDLMNFNQLDPAAAFPIQKYNVEIIHYAEVTQVNGSFNGAQNRVPQDLFDQYATDDLRKTIFFRNRGTGENGTFSYRGSYGGFVNLFAGVATDEIYLIRAECRARRNDVAGAMADLNTLLVTRWRTGTFVPFATANANESLTLILKERRKELIRRGLRWGDLKRLNLEAGRETTLYRTVNGQNYTLLPNSPRYVFPIPDYVIAFNGFQQNPR